MSTKRPPALKNVQLTCPKCNQTVKILAELGFNERGKGEWHAIAVSNCIKCAQKVDLHIKATENGNLYAPSPGSTGKPEWVLFGQMDFETGTIVTLDQRVPDPN